MLPLNESDIGFMQALLTRPESYHYDADKAKTSDEIREECLSYCKRSKALPDEGAIRWIVKSKEERIGDVHVKLPDAAQTCLKAVTLKHPFLKKELCFLK